MIKKLTSIFLLSILCSSEAMNDPAVEAPEGFLAGKNIPSVVIAKIINNTEQDLKLSWSNGRNIFLPSNDSIKYNWKVPFKCNVKTGQIESTRNIMLSSSNGIRIIFNKMVKTFNNNKTQFEASVYIGRKDEESYTILVFYADKAGKLNDKPSKKSWHEERIPDYNDEHDQFEYKIKFTGNDNIELDLYQKEKTKEKKSVMIKAKKIIKKLMPKKKT